MFLVSLFLVACVHRSGATFSHPDESRIADHKELPWQALLMKRANESSYGGVIVSPYYVFTACKRERLFLDLEEGETLYSNYRVLAGTISIRPYEYQGAQVRWIYYWENHPKCRSGGGDQAYQLYDISVIKVTQMFIFNSYVQPMPFERDQAKMKKIVDEWIVSNKTCTFGGFGGYRFEDIQFFEEDGSAEYTPENPYEDHDCCISKYLRVIDMRMMNYSECLGDPGWYFVYYEVFLQDPPVDAFCAIGVGGEGTSSFMNKTGMVCNLESGGPLQCRRDDGDKAGEYLVIGHSSFQEPCTILSSNRPQIFTRYDWELHEWIMQFYNPDQFGDHWVDAEYDSPIEYCSRWAYSGPIPPHDIS